MNLLLMLESDGPNVNKTVCNCDSDRPGLLDIGTYNLHICHNAFEKGLAMYGHNTSELVIDLHQRQEDCGQIQESLGTPAHKFLKHVGCR